jgi:hypothetical protein
METESLVEGSLLGIKMETRIAYPDYAEADIATIMLARATARKIALHELIPCE